MTIEAKIQRFGNSVVLADAAVEIDIEPSWFSPTFWGKDIAVTPGGRGASWFVSNANGDYVLRHYQRGGLAARVSRDRYWFAGGERTRSFAEWRLLATMFSQGLPVPRPLAAHYRRRGSLYQADLLLERLPDVATLAQRLIEAGGVDWSAVGRCIRRFHVAGICHADLNAHNILLGASGAKENVHLIDFDRGRRRASGAWQAANLDRLQRSLRKVLGVDYQSTVADGWQQLIDAYWA